MERTLSRRQFASLLAAAGAAGAAAGVMGGSKAVAQEGAGEDAADISAAAVLVPGTYSATVQSIGGPLSVEVALSGSAIESVEVTECHDSDGVAQNAIAQICRQVVERQSVDVDGLTGATMTSLYLKQAISDAVAQGASDMGAFEQEAPFSASAQEDMDVDVVVVGGGVAGLGTAAMASDKGLRVALVEKNGFLGGNALVCEALAIGSQTEPIQSRFQDMVETIRSYGATFHESAGSTEALPIIVMDPVDGVSGMGAFIDVLIKRAEGNGAVLLTDNECQGLVVEDGAVVGVTVQPKGQQPYTISAKAVVLATGGFSASADLVAEHLPQYAGIACGGFRGATGDALKWIEDVDGQTIMLDSDAQFYNNNPKTGSRATGGFWYPLYVDARGEAFSDSAYYTDAAHAAWEAFGSDTYYAVISEAEVEGNEDTRWFLDHMLEAEDTYPYSSIEGIASDYGLDGLAGAAETFGYEPEGTYYLSPCRATIYATYGGILVDEKGEVLNGDDEPVPGLYACGEAIGSQNFQQNGLYVGQVGQSLTMGLVVAESVAAQVQA